jgi:hypothetical protein
MQKLGFCPAAIALFTCSLGWTQATVNENLETSIIYVDVKNGSDGNPGTQSAPLQTIGAALVIAKTNNAAGIGTRIIINPGTYREALTITAGPNRNSKVPMTLQAAKNGTVFVSGAVQYTGWAPYSSNPNIYTATWPNRWGLCEAAGGNGPLEQPIVMRREMIFVDGLPMTQVLSLSQMIFPSTFYVDETHAVVYVWPPSGTNMATADVEVATNPQLVQVSSLNGKPINGIVFRGLTFEYANSCRKDAAFFVNGSVTNLLLDSDSFLWNNAQGLSINESASNATVLNSTALHNGAAGFHTFQVKNILWQGSTASYNNWRGAQGVYYIWDVGGYHLRGDHNETITGGNTTNNQTAGVHWDTDNQNVTVSSLFDSDNVRGTLSEKNEGPLTITNSKFCNSTYASSASGGFVLRNSQNTNITNNTFYNNSISQVLVTGVAGGIQVTNWETGEEYNLITQNLTLARNTLEGIGTAQQLFKDGYLDGPDWTDFQSTLKSDNNTWWNATNTRPFSVPTPYQGTLESFVGWQSATGQDLHSTFAVPATNPASECKAATAGGRDYWLLVDNVLVTTDLAGNAVFNLTTSSLGGFSGNVKLALDGGATIPGATATLSAGTIPATGASVLTFNAGINTPADTYTFTILANSGNLTHTATVTVTVPKQTVRLSATLLNFPNQKIDTTSPPQTIIMTNLGNSSLSMTSITTTYGFAQTHTCGTSLAAGASCNISVTFTPHNLTPYAGTLTITDSAAGSPQEVTLTGTVI